MLRLTMALLIAMAVCETAEGADKAASRHSPYRGWHRPAVILPAGLPRPHYSFRTTISYGPAPAHLRPYGRPVNSIYEDRLPSACGVYGYC
jgi:hypothetical protein